MRFFDVSMPISDDMLVYPQDPKTKIKQVRSNPLVSKVTMGLHTGTHVDAPIHYISGGKTLYEVGLERLNGAARVCDFTDV